MAAHDSFTELMTRLRAGEDAATEVFERYAQRLHGLARRHLDTVLKRKVDPEAWSSPRTRAFSSATAPGPWRCATGTT